MNKAIFEAFDAFLEKKNLHFEGVAIGGSALILLGVTSRATRDIDFVSPVIPDDIKQASEEFAATETHLNLQKKWFNNEPISLQKELPKNWELRLQRIFDGKNLKLLALGKEDLLKTKLFAFCDRTQPDFADLLNMKPTAAEIDEAFEWVASRDQNPTWPSHVETAFVSLKKALGYG